MKKKLYHLRNGERFKRTVLGVTHVGEARGIVNIGAEEPTHFKYRLISERKPHRKTYQVKSNIDIYTPVLDDVVQVIK